jgi:glycosyltransferase involved in cell wall biosynthesis
MGPGLGLSIPLFNEEAVAEEFIRSVHAALTGALIPHKLILVDNGSTDGTGALVNRLSVELGACTALHLSENAGYGGGILAGLGQLDTPIVGWMWGDGQIDAETLVACYRALVDGDHDLAKVHRIERNDGLQRKLVSSVYNKWMQQKGSGVCDANGCPKLMTREAFEALALNATDWFLDAEVVLKAAKRGWTWASVEAVMLPRAGGFSKVDNSTIFEFVDRLLAWR